MNAQSLCRFSRPKIDGIIDSRSLAVYRMIRRMGDNIKACRNFCNPDFFRRSKARVRGVAVFSRHKNGFLVYRRDVGFLNLLFPRCKDVVKVALGLVFFAGLKKRRVKENISDSEKRNFGNGRIFLRNDLLLFRNRLFKNGSICFCNFRFLNFGRFLCHLMRFRTRNDQKENGQKKNSHGYPKEVSTNLSSG